MNKLLIIGGAGDASQFISEIFQCVGGYEIYSVDKRPAVLPALHYLQFDIPQGPISHLSELIQSCDVIAICIPLSIFIQVLPDFLSCILDGTLLIDTFSVKSKYINDVLREVDYHKKNIGILSLHPLFKPELGIKHHNIIASQFPTHFDCDAVYHAIEQLGGHVIKTNENDKLMSLIQIVPHSLMLVYGLVLMNSGISFSQIMEVSTPPVQKLLCLLSRILSGTPQVYWEIQHENPYAYDVHATTLEAFQQFSHVVSNEDGAGFSNLLQALKCYMGQNTVDALSHQCAQLLQQNSISLNVQ